jgi:hypothetical protein
MRKTSRNRKLELEDAAVAIGAFAWIGGFFLALGLAMHHIAF